MATPKTKVPDLPHVSMITDEEIAQAICNFAAKKQMGIDPDLHHIEFKVTYRQVKGDGGSRLFASIVVTNVKPISTRDRDNAEEPAQS